MGCLDLEVGGGGGGWEGYNKSCENAKYLPGIYILDYHGLAFQLVLRSLCQNFDQKIVSRVWSNIIKIV